MSEIPRRYKEADEYSIDEELKAVQARRRGDAEPQFETAAYRQYRSDVLREGGLGDEADETETGEPPPLAERSVHEHFDRIRAGE